MPAFQADRSGFLAGVGGLSLHYRAWLPRWKLAGKVVLVHGLGDHSGRWREAALRLAGEGLAAYALDLRGFGLSGGRRGHVDSFDQLTGDLDCFLAFVRGENPAGRLFLLGHSLGGLIILDMALGRDDLAAGVILSSPCLAIRLKIPAWKRALAPLAGRWTPGLALASGLPAAYRSRNREAVRDYLGDPLAHDRVSGGLFREWTAAMARVRAGAGRLRVPSLFLQAGGDLLTDPGPVKEFYDRVPVLDKVFILYTDWYHEVFSEPGREQVHGDLLRWLRPRLGG